MEKDTGRVEAFSDGVFAIAITLLILEIRVPDLDAVVSDGHLFGALLRLWPSLLAFLFSFFGGVQAPSRPPRGLGRRPGAGAPRLRYVAGDLRRLGRPRSLERQRGTPSLRLPVARVDAPLLPLRTARRGGGRPERGLTGGAQGSSMDSTSASAATAASFSTGTDPTTQRRAT